MKEKTTIDKSIVFGCWYIILVLVEEESLNGERVQRISLRLHKKRQSWDAPLIICFDFGIPGCDPSPSFS
jgi:hypothetical protein